MNFISKPRITQLSFSRIKGWEKCPRQAKHKHIDKLPDGGNYATSRGADLHTLAEDYLNDPDKPCPPALQKIGSALLGLTQECDSFETEMRAAFDKYWKVVDFFDPTVFMRAVYDYFGVRDNYGLIVDHKSGKEYPEHQDQQELYALTGFHYNPDLEVIDTRMLYIDHGFQQGMNFTREADLERLTEIWAKRWDRVLADDVFAESPGSHCRWCSYSKSKGGPCQNG
jgi:hypothetical protein